MTEPTRSRRGGAPQRKKAAKPGTPVRNSMLLLLFAAILAVFVIALPKEPTGQSATLLAPGGESVSGEPQSLTLSICEVMASNQRAYPDDVGSYPDWIEIQNTGDEPVNLSGVGLSDREDRVLFVFPDAQLAPGEFAIVFCDDTNVALSGSPLHARFKISSLGETINLFDRYGYVADSVTIPALGSDMSYALTGDGWIITEQYTPGYPNTAEGHAALHSRTVSSANGLVINEVVASNVTSYADEDGEYSDWIELYNGGQLTITLSNYALSDDETNPVKWRFPQGAMLGPGEYYIVFASGKNRAGGEGRLPHTNFRLAAEGESVILSDILGKTIDRVTYDNLGKDVSWGRVPGTEYAWQEYAQPTPGLPNNWDGEVEMDARMRTKNTSGVFISEVVTSTSGLETPYGMTSYDWVELVNLGTQSVDLTGWGLSDSVGRPRAWQFPSITLAPGQHTLVFTSGLTESPTSSGATHADFRLSAAGETVVLSDPQGRIVDRLVVPRLETNNSFGRDFDRGGLFYYETPTAGARNASEGFAGYATTPIIGTRGTLITRPITVALEAPVGVRIRYTTDGSTPTETIGEDYTGPITISSAAVLRARGFQDGLKPSEIATESFLYNAYHILPVISLTVDPDDLWNPMTGIYADGLEETFEKIPFKQATYRLMKADDTMRERKANFEYFTPEGEQLLNQGVGVQLHGQFSLDIAQKSFRITARSRYGGASTLAYPFFDDRPFTEYKAVILRNGGNDGSYSRIVDTLISRIVDWTGSDIIHMAGAPCIVYLNGQYWGQYDIRERVNEHYIAMYEGLTNPRNIDLIKGDNDVLNGTFKNYNSLLEYVKRYDLNDQEALETVLDWVDVDNYFDFIIFETYFGNTDTLNIKFYRPQVDGAKWRWVLFDMDWGYWMRSTNGIRTWLKPEGSGVNNGNNRLIRALLNVPKMRDKFLTRYGELFQQYFSDTDRIIALIDEMYEAIEPEMGLHFNFWAGETRQVVASDPYLARNNAKGYWESRIKRLKNIAAARPHVVWGHVQEWFELTDAQMIAYFGERPAETEDIY